MYEGPSHKFLVYHGGFCRISLSLCTPLFCQENCGEKKIIFCWLCISLQILGNDQFHALFHVFISCLYTFWASQRSSSGDRIVLMHHLVWAVCVSECLVCQSGGIPSSHSHRLLIPDNVLIQFDLLMMSTVMLETYREV